MRRSTFARWQTPEFGRAGGKTHKLNLQELWNSHNSHVDNDIQIDAYDSHDSPQEQPLAPITRKRPPQNSLPSLTIAKRRLPCRRNHRIGNLDLYQIYPHAVAARSCTALTTTRLPCHHPAFLHPHALQLHQIDSLDLRLRRVLMHMHMYGSSNALHAHMQFSDHALPPVAVARVWRKQAGDGGSRMGRG